jgi:hypothetical protein
MRNTYTVKIVITSVIEAEDSEAALALAERQTFDAPDECEWDMQGMVDQNGVEYDGNGDVISE